MTLTISDFLDRTSALRALEALRNGVPNRDAVRALGPTQPRTVDAFESLLTQLDTPAGPATVEGLLLSADFGVGKSHTLRLLEQLALEQGFVVSTVVVSKETPLHDPTRLFLAAVRNARIPDARGEFVVNLANKSKAKGSRYNEFHDWALRGQPHQIVEASAVLFERLTNPDDTRAIIDYWSGDKIGVSDLRRMMKETKIDSKAFDLKQVKQAELAPVRFELVSRLTRAAGYKGWIILFDEVELIARYSVLQRAKAYAQLTRWLGAVPNQSTPGIGAVATISADYALAALDGRDLVQVPQKLRAKGDEPSLALLSLAEEGMSLISNSSLHLDEANSQTVVSAAERLANIYTTAYGVSPVIDPATMDANQFKDMRAYVRRWVNEWDLRRLHPDAVLDTEFEEIVTSYEEDKDLQVDSSDED
jgi:hypothetical protein